VSEFIVIGERALVAKLQRMTDTMCSGMLEKALVAGLTLTANTAKEKAPYRTGNLRRSIHVGDVASTSRSASAMVGTNVVYAKYLEYGTGIFAVRGDGRKKPWRFKGAFGWRWTRGIKPRPFMRPAWDATRKAVVATTLASLRDQLRTVR